jgi:hypothetical protein
MSGIAGLPSSRQPSVLDPRLNLGDIPSPVGKNAVAPKPSLTQQQRSVASRSSGTKTETATPAGKKVWVAREATREKMPSAFIVPPSPAPATRIGVDDLKVETQLKLNVNTNWVSLRGGELQIRCAPELSNLGKGPIYQVRGAKSTVNIAASNWVEAAKEGVRISAAGALAPRTQNIVRSKPISTKPKNLNPARKPPSPPSLPKTTKPFVPSPERPIPESEKINPYEDRPIRPMFSPIR